ncbi:YibE/F family protein, partial [Sediminihabitans luteus]
HREGRGHGHGHGHMLRGDARSTRRSRIVLAAIVVPVMIVTLLGAVHWWPSSDDLPDSIPFAADGTSIQQGTVVGPADDARGVVPARLDSASPGAPDPVGTVVDLAVPPEQIAHGFDVEDRVTLIHLGDVVGEATPYVFIDYSRGVPLGLLAAAYVAVVVLVARWRGLAALVGLAMAFAVVAWFTLPALLAGENAMAVALITSSLVMCMVLYVAHGISVRTSVALVGTLLGLVLTAAIATWASKTSNITGLSSEESIWLPQYAPALDIHGVVLCGIVLAGMGVLNDVTITQASAVWELREASPTAGRLELFRRAMRIGRDHIASTVYTIAFAYVGAALPLLLAVSMSERGFLANLTSGEIAEEVVRTLVGSIGLVLAIPATTAVAALTVPRPSAVDGKLDPDPAPTT